MPQIFEWPKIVDDLGTVTVTGWHQTTALRALGIWLSGATGLAMMIHPFFGTSSIVNDTVIKTLCFLEPHWIVQDVKIWSMVAQFFIGCGIGALAEKKLVNLYALVLRKRTRVEITANWIKIRGVRYPRGTNSIRFTNRLPAQAMRLENGDGPALLFGSTEKSATLRMEYGADCVVVAHFLKPEHADLFALALNAGLAGSLEQAPYCFEVLPAEEAVFPTESASDRAVIKRPSREVRSRALVRRRDHFANDV